jgi:hypothetical protein
MCGKPETIIIMIILGTGLFGGLTNYFMSFDKELEPRERNVKFCASILLSVCASLTVPLFLQILSNNLLDTFSFKNYLIFTGFCILASVYSKRFLEDVYAKLEKLDKKVDTTRIETKDKVDIVSKRAERAIKKVDDLEESIEIIEDLEIPTGLKQSIKEIRNFSLAEPEVERVVESLSSSKYSLRTIQGISKETEISVDKIKSLLEHLLEQGFIERKVGSNGKDLWRVLKYPIKIYSANYGAQGKTIDVTSKIKDLVSNNILEGHVSSAFLGVEDPAVDIVKVLTIHCRVYGKEKELTFTEGHNFFIR